MFSFTTGSIVISLKLEPAGSSGSATLNVNAVSKVSGSVPFATVSKPITKLANALSAGFVAELAKFAIFVPLPDCISIAPLLFANLMPASTKSGLLFNSFNIYSCADSAFVIGGFAFDKSISTSFLSTFPVLLSNISTLNFNTGLLAYA